MEQAQQDQVTVSVADAVRMLGICRSRVYQEIRAGRIQAVKSGRRTLIPVQSLHDWTSNLPPIVLAKSAA